MTIRRHERFQLVILLAALGVACTSSEETDVASHASASDTQLEMTDLAASDEADPATESDSNDSDATDGVDAEPEANDETTDGTPPLRDGGPSETPVTSPPDDGGPLKTPASPVVERGPVVEGGTDEPLVEGGMETSACGSGTPTWDMSEALGMCGATPCTICVTRTRDDRAEAYFVEFDDGCQCPKPEVLRAGDVDGGPDLPQLSADTCEHAPGYVTAQHAEAACEGIANCRVCEYSHWASGEVTNYSLVHADCDCAHEELETSCGSRLGLDPESDTAAWEIAACDGEAGCSVCPWQVDADGNTLSLTLHQCACPASIVVSD